MGTESAVVTAGNEVEPSDGSLTELSPEHADAKATTARLTIKRRIASSTRNIPWKGEARKSPKSLHNTGM